MSPSSSKLQPVILSGGSGTRLWPVSRSLYPKQFHSFTGDHTLLQNTTARAQKVCGANSNGTLVVCNDAHRFIVKEQLEEIGIDGFKVLLEPLPRNTAPAIAVAAFYLTKQDPDVTMLVLPSDHVIGDVDQFASCVDAAAELAQQDYLVTFGIAPTGPETGYGYILRGQDLSAADGDGRTFLVETFTEKPDLERARQYIGAGNYYWNSGMFVLKAATYLNELERFSPAIFAAAKNSIENASDDGVFVAIRSEDFSACPADSIDYAIMENTERAAMVPFSGGWSDVGSWCGVAEAIPEDQNKNVIQGDVFALDVENSVIIANDRLVSAVGIKDMVVVATDDAVLVTTKATDQRVKHLVEDLRAQKRIEVESHTKVYRPWGSYQTLDLGGRFQVKRLVIKPGASISLQLHRHRSEHWVVVSGTATVTRGDEVFNMTTNESTYIPVGIKHMLENKGKIDLEIIEVQTGDYLGEDDIVRFSDQYGRIDDK